MSQIAVTFAIVIPMYNEEQGAEQCVRVICGALEVLPNRTGLIVVNDGSCDATGEILARLKPQYPLLTVLTHAQNRGYGSALKTGIHSATEMGFEYVLFMDSDLTNDPKYIPHFIAKMEAGYDVIKASRYIKEGTMVGVPVWRMAISITGNHLARFLYGLPITDCTNGFRAVKTDILQQMELHENGFVIIMEELYQAKFLAKTFCEVPYTLTARPETIRPSSFVYRPKIFYDYIKYAIRSFLKQVPQHLN